MKIQRTKTSKRYAIDFDNTLTIGDTNWWEDYCIPIPNKENIDRVNKLYMEGHTIIIHSARPWEVARKTVAWLILNNVKFHGINFNKMSANCYIDDRAENWSKRK